MAPDLTYAAGVRQRKRELALMAKQYNDRIGPLERWRQKRNARQAAKVLRSTVRSLDEALIILRQ